MWQWIEVDIYKHCPLPNSIVLLKCKNQFSSPCSSLLLLCWWVQHCRVQLLGALLDVDSLFHLVHWVLLGEPKGPFLCLSHTGVDLRPHSYSHSFTCVLKGGGLISNIFNIFICCWILSKILRENTNKGFLDTVRIKWWRQHIYKKYRVPCIWTTSAAEGNLGHPSPHPKDLSSPQTVSDLFHHFSTTAGQWIPPQAEYLSGSTGASANLPSHLKDLGEPTRVWILLPENTGWVWESTGKTPYPEKPSWTHETTCDTAGSWLGHMLLTGRPSGQGRSEAAVTIQAKGWFTSIFLGWSA